MSTTSILSLVGAAVAGAATLIYMVWDKTRENKKLREAEERKIQQYENQYYQTPKPPTRWVYDYNRGMWVEEYVLPPQPQPQYYPPQPQPYYPQPQYQYPNNSYDSRRYLPDQNFDSLAGYNPNEDYYYAQRAAEYERQQNSFRNSYTTAYPPQYPAQQYVSGSCGQSYYNDDEACGYGWDPDNVYPQTRALQLKLMAEANQRKAEEQARAYAGWNQYAQPAAYNAVPPQAQYQRPVNSRPTTYTASGVINPNMVNDFLQYHGQIAAGIFNGTIPVPGPQGYTNNMYGTGRVAYR